MKKSSLCWLRRDLRLHDHPALHHALKDNDECYIVFVFDKVILDKVQNKNDKPVTFIIDSLLEIERLLQKHNSSLIICYGDPLVKIPQLVSELEVKNLYFNRDYEPYAKERDAIITDDLQKMGVDVHRYKDHAYYEQNEIRNGGGESYKVFTPYKKKWLENFIYTQNKIIPEYKCNLKRLAPIKNKKNIIDYNWFKTIGFLNSDSSFIGGTKEAKRLLKKFKMHIKDYKTARDIPALDQTSHLSPYIRFGNISIRDMVRLAVQNKNSGSETWLSEIIWRDFYLSILDVFPYVEKKCFRSEYNHIQWLGKKSNFNRWCEGNTGYPLVDAAMRCLNTTGLMNNRLRMIVASFLTKTLLIDWRLGERYFAEKLLDYDLAANNGGWQWSASTGVDAQPYFRIFNPYTQSKKFDPDGIFIKRWCPELKDLSSKDIHTPDTFSSIEYPHPIVSYREQRDSALSMYKKVK